MSERKVLNKYYPPDFDPSKLSKIKAERPKQHTVRIMTPFNMKCNTCGDYIAKAKKFNARKETVESEAYLSLKIYRFYIKCPKCMSEITFKTNPQTCDYEMECGAHRNFDALRLAILQEDREIEAEKEEERLNPMKLLENRTKQSKEEMEELEKLAQLKEENATKRDIDVNQIINRVVDEKEEQRLLEERLKREEEEDAEIARQWLELGYTKPIDDKADKPKLTNLFSSKSTNILADAESTNLKKRKLEGLITIKKKETKPVEETVETKKPKLISSLCSYSDSDCSDD